MCFEPLISWTELLEVTAEQRRVGYLTTNFFADERRMAPWISQGSLRLLRLPEGVLLRHQDYNFSHVWFFTDSVSKIAPLLVKAQYDESQPWVLDVVHQRGRSEDLLSAIQSAGARIYRRLFRMSRVISPDKRDLVPLEREEIRVAEQNDIPELLHLFQQYFDPLAEQIPGYEELKSWTVAKAVFVAVQNPVKKILGFVIFETMPRMTYLRYWFVCPEVRGKGIGGMLLSLFLNPPRGVRRQILWVLEDNDNSIKRYLHYGFLRETLEDSIFLFPGRGGKSRANTNSMDKMDAIDSSFP